MTAAGGRIAFRQPTVQGLDKLVSPAPIYAPVTPPRAPAYITIHAAGNVTSKIIAPVTATTGGQPAQVTFAGLAPTLAGVAQLNIVVPALLPGDYPLIVSIGGQSTNAGMVSVGR